jgi:hypothetical protein
MTATAEISGNIVVQFEVPPVIKEVLVPCTCAAAFDAFTAQIHQWWPMASHSLGGADTVGVTMEPRVNGRVFERHADGSEHLWGRVTAWEDPNRVAFTWHVGRSSEQAQSIEVTFGPAETGTRVRLVHSGWESLAADAQSTRDQYNKGWELVFVRCYADRAGAAASSEKS